jgi:membrane protein DedA with SNARE-associated domain
MNGLYERFGVPIVLLAALSEATVGLGVIIPGVVVMFLAGAYSAGDPARLALVFLVSIVGTALGDTLSYSLGRWGSRFVEGTRFAPSLRLGRALISGRTRWLIPFYHLHSVTRTVGPFGSGAVRMPLRVWMPLDYTGAIIANTVWVGGGAVFGTTVLTEDGTLEQHPLLRIGLAVLAVAWFLLVQREVMRRLEETGAFAKSDASSKDVDDAAEAHEEARVR